MGNVSEFLSEPFCANVGVAKKLETQAPLDTESAAKSAKEILLEYLNFFDVMVFSIKTNSPANVLYDGLKVNGSCPNGMQIS